MIDAIDLPVGTARCAVRIARPSILATSRTPQRGIPTKETL